MIPGAFFKIPFGFGSDAERGKWICLSSTRVMMSSPECSGGCSKGVGNDGQM